MRISVHQTLGVRMRRLGTWPLVGALLLGSSLASAGPVNVSYLKDAKADSTSPSPSGSTTPDIFFSTPLAGLNQTTYTQAAETVTAIESQIAGSGSSSTTYQASMSAGRLRASSSSTVAGTYGGTSGGISTSAQQVMRIRDTLNASAGNAGSALSLTLSLRLDSLLSAFNVPTGANSALCGFGDISMFADVGSARITALGRNLCVGSDSMSVSATFNVIDGQDFDLTLGMGLLTQASMGAGNGRFGSGVSIDALNTGLAFLVGPSNYRLTSTSGYSYATTGGGGGTVPEPATLALVCVALLTLPATRRLRRRAG